jgi:hypothetical protein
LALQLSLVSTVAARADGAIPIRWDDLPDPAAAQFDDPFRALTTGQLVDLRRIVRLDARLGQSNVHPSARTRLEGHREALEDRLAASGADADALIGAMEDVARRRREAGLAVNPVLRGEDVVIEGYAFPGPPLGDGRPTAYVVPQVGMCSHLPPPPPNRLVRAVLPEGNPLSGVYVPVTVSGRLRAEVTEVEAFVVDGLQTLQSAVLIEDARLVTLGESAQLVPPHAQ